MDDQPLFLVGVETLLQASDSFCVVGKATNGEEAVKKVLALQPDVILMDLKMPVMDGVEATAEILAQNPKSKIVVLTTFDGDDLVVQALQAGAVAYLLKDCSREELEHAIWAAAKNEAYLHSKIAKTVISTFSQIKKRDQALQEYALTPREQEVLQKMVDGLDNKAIAKELFLSLGTIKNHITRIYEKMGVKNRTQAVAVSQQHYLFKR